MKLSKKKIKKIIKTGTKEEITKALLSYIPVLMSNRRKKIFTPTPVTPSVINVAERMFT